MWESLAKIAIPWLEKPARIMGAIVIAGVLFFALFQYPWFSSAVKDHLLRWPLGGVLFAGSFLLTYPIELAWKTISHKRQQRRMISRLNNLTPHEKKVLNRYLENESTTENWGRGVGTVEVLARDGILSLIASDPDERNMEPDCYALDLGAWKHLKKYPELLNHRLDAG